MVGIKIQVNLKALLPDLVDRLKWEVVQGITVFWRRFGLLGLVLVICGIGVALVEQQQTKAMAALKARIGEKPQTTAMPVEPHGFDGRAGLRAFDDYLPPQEDIPGVVQDMLKIAEAEHLSIMRGEYRAQSDEQGHFMRYQMILPIKGNAQAIHRFIQAALLTQKTLALESVQFKRERIESADIEARIQWVVFTRLPSKAAGLIRAHSAVSGMDQ